MAQHPALRVTHSIALLTLVSGCLPFSSAIGQSFDCKKASTTVDQAICGDKGLADLDEQLANNVRKLVAAQPAMAATYLDDEREWIRERDHHCTAPDEEQSLNDCLVAYDLARFADIRSRAHIGAVRRAPKLVCQVIADRYRPLAHSHPGEPPLDVLAGSPTSGIQLVKQTDWVKMPSRDLTAWAAAQKPPFSISAAVLYSLKQYEKLGGVADLIRAPGAGLYTFEGDQESTDCPYNQSFVVQGGVAVPADTPGKPGEEGNCGAVQYGAVDTLPMAIEQHYDWQPGMTASLEVWNWDGQGFAHECEIELTYKPRFSEKTLAPQEETCNGSDCKELHGAAFTLAESAESDPQALQESSLEHLTAKQKKQFDSMQELFAKLHREPLSLDPFSLPYLFHDRLLLVSIGHYAGPREHQYADWSVEFLEIDDGKLVLRGSFPVGTGKGDLESVKVTEK